MSLTPAEVIEKFGGTQAAAARALGVSRAAVCKWVKAGKVPPLRQYQVTTRLRGDDRLQQAATSFRKEQMRG